MRTYKRLSQYHRYPLGMLQRLEKKPARELVLCVTLLSEGLHQLSEPGRICRDDRIVSSIESQRQQFKTPLQLNYYRN